MKRTRVGGLLRIVALAGLLGFLCAGGAAQQAASGADFSREESLKDTVQDLRLQVQELRSAVAEIRSEAQQYRAETLELRRELNAVRSGSEIQRTSANEPVAAASAQYGTSSPASTPQTPDDRKKSEHTANLEEEYQLLSGKVDEQYQTKIESASKYRMRLSGIVLLNLFGNGGTVDNIDTPSLAYDRPPGSSAGNFGATLRQSQIGFEVFGPTLMGARTKADLQMDFAGGFPRTWNGVNSGLVRLRTGTMRLDWAKTSIVAGQDGLFFSPLSPTSFASLAVPAFSYAGNLWSWVPQLRVEHRITLGENSSLLLQGGILDPLSGEPPPSAYYRQPVAGELSRVPAFGSRVAWVSSLFGQPLRVGLDGYYSRQDYGFNRAVNAWSGMTDVELPLGRQFSLSGELYRGSGLGGIGGGIGRSALFSGLPNLSSSSVRALNSVGGWAQLKYRPTSTLEFNGAFGQDNPFSSDLHAFPFPQSYGDPSLTRNQGSLANVIFRPRSDLLFSAEYHHVRTSTLVNGSYQANQVNLVMGVLF